MISVLLEDTGLVTALKSMPVIMGIVLAAFGIALAVLSKRVAKAVRKTNELNDDDKIVLGMRTFGLIFALIALVLVAFGSNLVL